MCLSVLGAVEGGEFMRAEFEILLKTWFYFVVFWVFGALLLFLLKMFRGGSIVQAFSQEIVFFSLDSYDAEHGGSPTYDRDPYVWQEYEK